LQASFRKRETLRAAAEKAVQPWHRDELLAAVARFPGRAAAGWADTTLALPEQWSGRRWRNIWTDATFEADVLDAATLFADLPVAVLVAA
jgi:maltooligosyltrehalose synthase